MPVLEQDRKTIENMFKAMQMGPSGEEAMMALFDEDAVFIEPFAGAPQTHTGKPAIRESFKQLWKDGPPDLTLTTERVDVDGENIRAQWKCTASVFPTPMKGYDLFRIHAGKIKRLEIIVTEAPPH